MATVATIGIGVGAAAIAAGAIVFLTGAGRSAPVAVIPGASPTSAAVTVLGRF
jgi:hypothetical protein